MIRRNLTPPIGIPVNGLPPTRRAGGARLNVSYRIGFFRGTQEMPGWALNLSRGGVRAVMEDRVELGEALDVHIEEIGVQRRGTVVWVQDEPDGAIVGIAFDEPIHTAPPGVELETTLDLTPRPAVVVAADPLPAEAADTAPRRVGGGSE